MASMIERFDLSEIQAKAIMDMRLRRLTGLERDKIEGEYNQLNLAIQDYREILGSDIRVIDIIKEQLLEIKRRFSDYRRTEIIDSALDMQDEDLIPVEDVVIALTTNGYIKRTNLDTYHLQNRGGKGVKGMTTHTDDVVDQFNFMSTHDYLMLFTNLGKVYRIKGYQIPLASRTAKGIPAINLLSLDKGEKIRSLVSINDSEQYKYIMFATEGGLVKRVDVKEFESIRQTGKIAIRLNEDDHLVSVKLTTGNDEIIIAGSNGKAVRFDENNVRVMGRNAAGVLGIRVDDSFVIGMTTDKEGEFLLALTEKGYGKKTPITDYRLTNRGAKGVKTINITEKNGPLIVLKAVSGDEDMLIVTDTGQVIRISVSDIGTYGRNTQGVRCINIGDNSVVSSAAIVKNEEEHE
jgi:DNA gyrase subunit A